MILAAGRGKRLRPITDHTPKPLVQVGSRRLIEHHLIRLASAGFQRVVINTSHLADQIEQTIGNGGKYGIETTFCHEPEALETAGGIVNALPYLRSESFLVINGDIYSDFPCQPQTLSSGCTMHLVLVQNPAHNPKGDFALHHSRVTSLTAKDTGFTFSGIGYYHRSVFEALSPGRSPLAPIIRSAISLGQVSGAVYRGIWIDVGTQDRLSQARKIANHNQRA